MPLIVSVCHTPIDLFDGVMGIFKLSGRGPVGAETCRFCTCPVPEVIEEPIDAGFNEKRYFVRRGIDVALALAGPFAQRGVFVAAGPVPKEEELLAAEERYHGFLRQKYEEGLSSWDDKHDPALIDAHAKIAAYVFRANAPWGLPARGTATVECENCGEPISPKLAYHTVCGAIFDEERAIALGYLPAMQAKKARLELEAAVAPRVEEPARAAAGKGR